MASFKPDEKFWRHPVESSFCLQRTDKLRGERRAQLKKSLLRLRRQRPASEDLADELTKVFLEVGLINGDEEAAHVRNDWFRGWYPRQNVAAVLLEGLYQAILAAGSGESEKPIAGYWIAGEDEKFRIAVTRTKQQVTILLITPRPATRTKLDLSQETAVPVWLVEQAREGATVTQLTTAPLLIGQTSAPRLRKKPAKSPRRK